MVESRTSCSIGKPVSDNIFKHLLYDSDKIQTQDLPLSHMATMWVLPCQVRLGLNHGPFAQWADALPSSFAYGMTTTEFKPQNLSRCHKTTAAVCYALLRCVSPYCSVLRLTALCQPYCVVLHLTCQAASVAPPWWSSPAPSLTPGIASPSTQNMEGLSWVDLCLFSTSTLTAYNKSNKSTTQKQLK